MTREEAKARAFWYKPLEFIERVRGLIHQPMIVELIAETRNLTLDHAEVVVAHRIGELQPCDFFT